MFHHKESADVHLGLGEFLRRPELSFRLDESHHGDNATIDHPPNERIGIEVVVDICVDLVHVETAAILVSALCGEPLPRVVADLVHQLAVRLVESDQHQSSVLRS